ncbi:MAG: phosphotransferase family protein [Ilumatobacteraceae bacterium]
MSAGDVVEEIADGLRRTLGASVTELSRLSGGASRETWRFVADGRPLILQRQRAGDTRDMSVEAAVLRAASRAAVPVPELLASGREEGGASFMVLSLVDGETIARKILRDDRFAVARGNLVSQFASALAAIHSIDAAEVPGLPTTDQVAQYRQSLDDLNEQLQQAHPTFELAFRWLERNRPTTARRCVVHGDFRLGNVMVGDDGLRAVLDWELSHVGDPMEDLGWLCVRAWRFGSEHPVAGIGDYDTLLDEYQKASGLPADRDALRWWEVLGTLKWGIMCMLQASAHLLGFSRSHELAAIGRRVCENEYDILLALEGRWSSLEVR